jgi:hypothetical protein
LKLLADVIYDEQVERLSGLSKFPALPKARQELCHALRRITEADGEFLHRLISDVVDTHSVCPTPAELIQLAGAKRHRTRTNLGKADCELCQGSGFVTTIRKVALPGLEPYDAEFAAACTCRGATS